jgi:hypothetical protein
MSAAAHCVQVFGVGPFHIMPRAQNTCRYRGADASVDIQIGVAQAGPVQVELTQDYTPGNSVFKDLAMVHGQRSFGVAQYIDRKFELACEFTNSGQRVALFDTVEDLGFFTEIVEEEPSFQTNLAKISHTCEAWDGTEPIRVLTRDGYRVPDDRNSN